MIKTAPILSSHISMSSNPIIVSKNKLIQVLVIKSVLLLILTFPSNISKINNSSINFNYIILKFYLQIIIHIFQQQEDKILIIRYISKTLNIQYICPINKSYISISYNLKINIFQHPIIPICAKLISSHLLISKLFIHYLLLYIQYPRVPFSSAIISINPNTIIFTSQYLNILILQSYHPFYLIKPHPLILI